MTVTKLNFLLSTTLSEILFIPFKFITNGMVGLWYFTAYFKDI